MPFTAENHYILGRHPSHIQIKLAVSGGKGVVYLPVKSLSWDWAIEQTPNLHSGSTLPSDLIDGHKQYTVRFTTSTWLVEGANKWDAEKWEFMTYYYLVLPELEGRPREFDITISESDSIDVLEQELGDASRGGHINTFRRCKINKMGYNQGQNGIIERTYEAGAMRVIWGPNQEEQGGQG